jgi:hypothetical protein
MLSHYPLCTLHQMSAESKDVSVRPLTYSIFHTEFHCGRGRGGGG